MRLGIGHRAKKYIEVRDWNLIKSLAEKQGLYAIVLDGIDSLRQNYYPSEKGCSGEIILPTQKMMLEWIGEVLQGYEYRYEKYRKTIAELACLYNTHGYKMMILKGYACSLNWPKPSHRPCGDIDIWQFGNYKQADELVTKERGIKVDYSHHHHTVFYWGDFTIENHYDFINTHRHYSHRGLEEIFKELGQDDSHYVEVNGNKVYIPSPNLHALFLIRHALNHFVSTGINLRQVLDWAFFVEKHTKEIDWDWLMGILKKYHMVEFFKCMNAICVDDLGFDANIFNGIQFNHILKDKVLNDILSPEYDVEASLSNILKRWKKNRWKHAICYNENRWKSFMYGVWSHLLKPKDI